MSVVPAELWEVLCYSYMCQVFSSYLFIKREPADISNVTESHLLTISLFTWVSCINFQILIMYSSDPNGRELASTFVDAEYNILKMNRKNVL